MGPNNGLIDTSKHAHKIPKNTAAREKYDKPNNRNGTQEDAPHDGEDNDLMRTNPSPLYNGRPHSDQGLVTLV